MSRYVKAIYSLLEVDGGSFDRLNFDLKILIVVLETYVIGYIDIASFNRKLMVLDNFLCMLFNDHVGEYTK